MLSLSPFTDEETEAHLVWAIPLVGFKLGFEPRPFGSTSSDPDHYNTESIKIIIMIMIKSKLCVKHCYWQGEDETYASK